MVPLYTNQRINEIVDRMIKTEKKITKLYPGDREDKGQKVTSKSSEKAQEFNAFLKKEIGAELRKVRNDYEQQLEFEIANVHKHYHRENQEHDIMELNNRHSEMAENEKVCRFEERQSAETWIQEQFGSAAAAEYRTYSEARPAPESIINMPMKSQSVTA